MRWSRSTLHAALGTHGRLILTSAPSLGPRIPLSALRSKLVSVPSSSNNNNNNSINNNNHSRKHTVVWLWHQHRHWVHVYLCQHWEVTQPQCLFLLVIIIVFIIIILVVVIIVGNTSDILVSKINLVSITVLCVTGLFSIVFQFWNTFQFQLSVYKSFLFQFQFLFPFQGLLYWSINR